jgi:hypothetical protein
MIAPQSGRLDRYVRRSYLSISEGASQSRIAYSVEEALRLAHLPGEDEGRIYCFRRIAISQIAPEANRRIWTESVQQVLGAAASQAVHASDPGAERSGAVFFNNREEALEMLLRRALRMRSASHSATAPWYAASVLGIEPAASHEQQIPIIVAQLFRPDSPAPMAAAILFAALDGGEPTALLSAIPPDTIRDWIHELDSPAQGAEEAPALQLPEKLRAVLRRAAIGFGWKDTATVWLAAQAVLCVAPGTFTAGTAVRRARSTLRMMEAEQRGEPVPRVAENRGDIRRALVFDDDETGKQETPASEILPYEQPRGEARNAASPDTSALPEAPSQAARREIRIVDEIDGTQHLRGEFTPDAGLYFLLNALRHLGIAAAVEASPELVEADFAAHILRRLALQAGVAENDPILCCLPAVESEFLLPDDAVAELEDRLDCWPSGFRSPAKLDQERLLRVWVLAVRRWCWRTGRITSREVVHRNGRVWLTRTDLDVTLPLDLVDIRIRHVGLDIDPGWLPWFRAWGRVVRFHYRNAESGIRP